MTPAEVERLRELRLACVRVDTVCMRAMYNGTINSQKLMEAIGGFIAARRLMYKANDIQASCVSYHADVAVERLRATTQHQTFEPEVRADEH